MNALRKRKEALAFLSQFRKGENEFDISSAVEAMKHLPNERFRRVMPTFRRLADKQIRVSSEEIQAVETKIALLKASEPEHEALREWANGQLVLEQPHGSWLHHLRQELRDGGAVFLRHTDFDAIEFDAALGEASAFVVEHDWAKAFAGAGDFSEGEFRLPYDSCAFEFQIAGWRVIALMTTVDDVVMMQLFARGPSLWFLDDDIARHDNGKWTLWHAGRSPERNLLQSIVEYVGAQVRAISIALDAEVAEAEAIRSSETLSRAREKAGKVPPKPYHVVSLTRRPRLTAPASMGGTGTRKRLHFRRGHWRHFENHKTWIRWMLVGDPDLGFVDKEYRL